MFTRANESLIRSIASIRAMRLDNLTVDSLIIPAGWLLENGVVVSVVRELSALNPDGSIALAGESFQSVICFTSAAVNERCIFYLPGVSRGAWSQHNVDVQVVRVLEKHEQHLKISGVNSELLAYTNVTTSIASELNTLIWEELR